MTESSSEPLDPPRGPEPVILGFYVKTKYSSYVCTWLIVSHK
jgi:hypothetical protein